MSIALPPLSQDAVSFETLADLVERLGGVPLDRIRLRPFPGTATIDDVVRLQEKHGVLCELVDGTLVEKPMGYVESRLAMSPPRGAMRRCRVRCSFSTGFLPTFSRVTR